MTKENTQDINIDNVPVTKQDDKIQQQRVERCQKAAGEIKEVLNKYNVCLYVAPGLEFHAEAKLKATQSKEVIDKTILKVRKKLKSMLAKANVYLRSVPEIQIRTRDQVHQKFSIPEGS